MSYSPFVEELVKSIVATPESVQIDDVLEGNTRTIIIRVAQEHVGKVIGKSGRVISAIRQVVSAIASKSKEKAFVKVVTPE